MTKKEQIKNDLEELQKEFGVEAINKRIDSIRERSLQLEKEKKEKRKDLQANGEKPRNRYMIDLWFHIHSARQGCGCLPWKE